MVTDPQTLAMYAALAEVVYRRDSVNDQALSYDDLKALTGGVAILPKEAEGGVTVTGQDGNPLVSWTDAQGVAHADLATDGEYYYSDRAFSGAIVKVGSEYVVVFRGTDTTLSGWSSVLAVAARDDTDSYTPNVIARPQSSRGDPGNPRCVPGSAGLPRRPHPELAEGRLLAMTGEGILGAVPAHA